MIAWAYQFAWQRCLLALLVTAVLAGAAHAQDLNVASDGDHLWLAVTGYPVEGEPQVQVYHRVKGDDIAMMRTLDPIPGTLGRNGVFAGGGQLVIAMADDAFVSVRPVFSEFEKRWVYEYSTWPAIPDACSVSALAAGDETIWALVRVETAEALERLASPQGGARPDIRSGDELLDMSMGLPPGVFGDAEPDASNEEVATPVDGEAADPPESEGNPEAPPLEEPSEGGPAADQAEVDAEVEAEPKPFVATYVLIRVRQHRWSSVPMPEGFDRPALAELLMRSPDDARPIVLMRPRGSSLNQLVSWRYTEGEWARRQYVVTRAWSWSAAIVQDQVVVGIERSRDENGVTVELVLLRDNRARRIGELNTRSTDLPRWRIISYDGDATLVARPGPAMLKPEQGEAPIALIGLSSVNMMGTVTRDLDVMLINTMPDVSKSVDIYIQLIAIGIALTVLMLHWQKTPYNKPVEFRDHVMIAPWGRRVIGGCIDLVPGVVLTLALYKSMGIGWRELALNWPGNFVDKPWAALRPALWVIGITVFHTTAFEFITARSIGKWLTGTYVADYRGRPAPPVPSIFRALLRTIDMLAPMMIFLPALTPHRQRLGDVLCKTMVVCRTPDAPPDVTGGRPDPNDDWGKW